MYMNDGNKTKINLRNKSVFITGVAGFIGSNLAKRLLSTVEGVKVVGLDNMNHYYDVRLKEARLNELEQFDNFSFVKGNLANKAVIESIFEQYKPEIVVNLGAQAGVRYSITNPDAYVEANLIGFYNILEACRHSYDEGHTPVEHLVYASSSSVYGSNKKVPYSTDDKVDNPVSLYAATKKSNELMAHAYSKLYNIPSTGLRFFTVYGPAGRPDMAYFGFTIRITALSVCVIVVIIDGDEPNPHLFKKLHKKSQPQDFTLNESPVAGLLYGNRFLVFKGSLLLLLLSLFFLLSIFQFDMQPIQH